MENSEKSKRPRTTKKDLAVIKENSLAAKKAAKDEKKKLDVGTKAVLSKHKMYVDILHKIQAGLSSTEIICQIAEEYGYAMSTTASYFYEATKYWRSIYNQEDVDLLRYVLREKYEYIVNQAIVAGDLKSAKGSLDSIRKMFGLDKTEVEIVNKEIKFKFDSVPDLTPEPTPQSDEITNMIIEDIEETKFNELED